MHNAMTATRIAEGVRGATLPLSVARASQAYTVSSDCWQRLDVKGIARSGATG
jgi:hypothetical protein